jgi:hypothetical protein
MAIHRPVRLWRAQLQAAEVLELPDLSGAAWIQMIDGELEQPWLLQRGDGFGWTPRPAGVAVPPTLTAGSAGADLLLFELH